MIYLFNKSMELKKIATSKNVLSGHHEHELNNLIISDIVLPLDYAKEFIDDIYYFGYYYEGIYQLHRITKTQKIHQDEAIKINGRHIFFDDMLGYNIIKDVRPQNRDPKYILDNTIGTHTRWQVVTTDVFKTGSDNYYYVLPMEVLDKVVEKFKIEYIPEILFDGQNINGYLLHIAERIGEKTSKRIPFGSRVLELTGKSDYETISTRIIGRGKGEEVGEGYGRRIEFTDLSFSRNGVVSKIGENFMENKALTELYGYDDGTAKHEVVEFEEIEDVKELAEATYEYYINAARPKMKFSANVTDIGKVGIGDSVTIIVHDHGLYLDMRIHKITGDLLNTSDVKVELGDYAFFKESKVERKTREKNEGFKKQTRYMLENLKREKNAEFDDIEKQFYAELEQAKIDATAEVEAMAQRMQTDLSEQRGEMLQRIETAEQDAYDRAAEAIQQNSNEIMGNLDAFKQIHQDLYDEVTGDVMDISEFLGDMTTPLASQFETVKQNHQQAVSDIKGLQTDLQTTRDNIKTIGDDLTSTKSDLQQQIDDADSSIITANDKISAAEGRITDAEGKLVTNDQNIADAQKRITQAEQDISEHGTDIGTVQQTLTNIDGELASKVERTEYDALEGTVTSHGTRISQNETDISSKAEQTEVDTISGTVSDHSTQISQNATDIKSKADSTTVDSIDETVTSHSTLISQNATDIQSKADASVVDSLAGTVENHSTEISQNAQRIESKAEQSIVDTLSGTVSDHESRITQNAKGIESKVSSEELKASIDGIEVGGRNYQPDVTKGYSVSGADVIEVKNGLEITYTRLEGSTPYVFLQNTRPLSVGEEHNINFYATLLNPPEEYEQLDIKYGIRGVSSDTRHILKSGERTRVSHNFVAQVTETGQGRFIIFPTSVNSITDVQPKILIEYVTVSKGNLPMDWTPAPEDTEAKITDINTTLTSHDTRITQTAEEITSKADKTVVDSIGKTVSSHGTTISQTAEALERKAESSVVDTLSNTVSNHTLEITETAENIQSLLTKTESHDSDITKWSNATKENAEEIARTITRVTNAEGEIKSAQTNISANADAIRLKANQSSLDAVTGRVDSAEASLEVQAGQITGIVSRVSDAEGRVSTAESNIKANADAIKLRVTETYVEGAIDNIKIGGRNLLKNSKLIEHSIGQNNTMIWVPDETGTHTISFDYEIYEENTPITYFLLYSGASKTAAWVTLKGPGESRASKTFDITEDMVGRELYLYAGQSSQVSRETRMDFIEVQLERGNKATDWDVNPDEVISDITSITAELNVEAGKIQSLVAKTDGHDAQLSTIIQDYNSIEQTVANNNQWINNNGSTLIQTAEGFSQKVWMDDISNINANLIPLARNAWEYGSFWSSGSYNNNLEEIRTRDYIEVTQGNTYTISDYSAYVSRIRSIGFYEWLDDEFIRVFWRPRQSTGWSFTAKGNRIKIALFPFEGSYIPIDFVDFHDDRIKMKLEKGNQATPIINSISEVEQMAHKINLKVAELSQVDGENILTQSDISIQSDRILFGSKSLGASTMASIISVSPAAIDIITDKLNLTGNLNVKGQIETISMNAIEANIGSIRTAILKANVITSDMIDSNVIRAEHIFVQEAMVEDIMAKNIFSDKVKTLSLEAAYANIGSLRTRILTTDVILSEHVNASMAIIDKLFSSSAYISRLTGKSAFITDINAIEIRANSTILTTMMNRFGEVEGGLTILRPDAYGSYGIYVQNGIPNMDVDVQRNQFMHGGVVSWTGQRYQMSGRNMTANELYNCETIYSSHKSKYITIGFGINISGSSSAYVLVELREFGSGNLVGTHRQFVSAGETHWNDIRLNLGVPDYVTPKSFYVKAGLETRADATYLQLVVNRVNMHG